MNYRCIYEIDIEADTPEEAARETFSIMVDPASQLPVISTAECPDGWDPRLVLGRADLATDLLAFVYRRRLVGQTREDLLAELQAAVDLGKQVTWTEIDLSEDA